MPQGGGVKKSSSKFSSVPSKSKGKATKKNKPLGPRKGGKLHRLIVEQF